MPISVPKWAREELEYALKTMRTGGYMGAGGLAINELYSRIKRELDARNVPHKTHRDTSTIPADHVHWKP